MHNFGVPGPGERHMQGTAFPCSGSLPAWSRVSGRSNGVLRGGPFLGAEAAWNVLEMGVTGQAPSLQIPAPGASPACHKQHPHQGTLGRASPAQPESGLGRIPGLAGQEGPEDVRQQVPKSHRGSRPLPAPGTSGRVSTAGPLGDCPAPMTPHTPLQRNALLLPYLPCNRAGV